MKQKRVLVVLITLMSALGLMVAAVTALDQPATGPSSLAEARQVTADLGTTTVDNTQLLDAEPLADGEVLAAAGAETAVLGGWHRLEALGDGVRIVWDGSTDAAAINTTGLGGADFAAGNLRDHLALNVVAIDAPLQAVWTVYGTDGTSAQASHTLARTGVASVPFAAFSGLVDWANVGALVLELHGQTEGLVLGELAAASSLIHTHQRTLVEDLNGNGRADAGDVVEHTITLVNENETATAPVTVAPVYGRHTLVAGTLAASQGTIAQGRVAVGAISGSAAITYRTNQAVEAIVPGEVVVQQGDMPPGGGGLPVDGLNTPNADGAGNVGFSGDLDDGANDNEMVWHGSGIVWLSTDILSDVGSIESFMGIGNGGAFAISPNLNPGTLDAAWSHDGRLVVEEDAAPGIPGNFIVFASRPSMSANGTAYWVSGYGDTQGGTTQNRVLYKSEDTVTPVIDPVLQSGDVISGFIIQGGSAGIEFEYAVSDDDAHLLMELDMDTGSTTDDGFVYLDGALLFREGNPVPGGGENWDNFDMFSVNEAGNYLFSGDTDGDIASDEFIAYNGGFQVREGDTVDGVILGTIVRHISINNLNHAAFIWTTSTGTTEEAMFYTCDAANMADASLVLITGDELDIDGNGTPDATVTDFNTNSSSQLFNIAEDGKLYVNVDLDYGAGGIPAIVGVDAPSCTAATLNEARIDQSGTDDDEYFELMGEAGTSLDGLYYLVLGDDGSGSSGVVEAVINLTGTVVPADGHFLAVETTSVYSPVADLVLAGSELNFENSDNVTHLLVQNFTGALNDDLDTDDDGVLDITPWDTIDDCVALIETVGSGEHVYCATTVGPDGAFAPGHVYYCSNDGWLIGAFDPVGADDTPGAPNTCPVAAITLAKTVGTDPNVCATTDAVDIPPGTDVTYCYEVTNTGDISLTLHDLDDSELGTILASFPYTLAPAASVFVTQTANINQTTVNTAVWTGYNPGPTDAISATDSATVNVVQPAIILAKTVGTDPNACAATNNIIVAPNTQVTYCYEVTNIGLTTLTVHDLVDSELGTILSGFNFSLAPAASVFVTTTTTITETTVNSATWTAYNPGPVDVASDSDMATVTVALPEPLICNGPAVEFEGGIPGGWTVVNNQPGNPVSWTDITGCGEAGNYATGNGNAACASSDLQGGGSGLYDTELWTQPIDLSSYNLVTLNYWANYGNFASVDFLDLDISVDGGSNWTNLLSWNEDHHPNGLRTAPGENVTVDLSAYGGQTSAILRWHYYDPTGPASSQDWYAQLDELSLSCAAGTPAIELAKTVGTDPLTCASTSTITVDAGEAVYYCYEVTNTGTVTLTLHDLVDDQLGNIFAGLPYTLTPGASIDTVAAGLTISTTLNTTTTNTAVWTAYDDTGFMATAVASATVNVQVPVIQVSPTSLSSSQLPDVQVTLPLTISNLGDGDLEWSIDEAPASALPAIAGAGETPAASGDAATYAETADTAVAGGESVVAPLSSFRWPQVVLYDNGPLVNCAGCGVGGADEAVLQNTSLGMNTLGFGHQVSAGNRVADDFTVTGGGWTIDTITFFAYQTGSTTTSTMTEVNLRIWDGSPDDPGSTVVFGDTSTNILAQTDWANVYRVTETTTGTATDRPVMANVVDLGGLFLPPGTYWLDWQTGGTLASGPWAPPININGQATTGNALQWTGAWGPANDSGTGAPQQGFPFIIEGNAGCTPGDIPWLTVAPTSGTTAPGGSSVVDVTFDSTGLSTGVYTGTVCINSNDALNPVVEVPITLTVEAPNYEVGLSTADADLSGAPGEVLTYSVSVSNNGDVADTYNLAVTGNVWTTILETVSVIVPAGDSVTVEVYVTVPAGAADGEMDVATISAISVNDPSATDSLDLTSTAVVVETDILIYLPFMAKP